MAFKQIVFSSYARLSKNYASSLNVKPVHFDKHMVFIFNGDLTITSSQLQELFYKLTVDKPVIIKVLSKVCACVCVSKCAPYNTTMHTFCC